MPFDFERIKEASAGLFYLSEGDYPFDVATVETSPTNLQQTLLALCGRTNDTTITADTLQHFFCNLTKQQPEETIDQQRLRLRYAALQEVLKEELPGVAVYLIGDIEVDAFILGSTGDNSYAGLRTKLVQT